VAEWNDLIGTIREQGLGDFLRPPTPERLAEAAEQGPIVMLNVSSYRSDAIVLTPDGLDVVELKGLQGPGSFRTEVDERARMFGEAIKQITEADAGPPAQAQARITGTLGWLWDSVAEPVLGRLGLLGDPPGSELPRVWWCGGGPLSLLPVHAAGRDGMAVIDKVISSYTPTVRALMHSRSRALNLDPAAGMLAVAMSLTPGAPALPSADTERKFLEATFSADTLFNEQATTDRVIAALPKYAIAHFACHGETDLADPSASRLLCHDHQSNALSVARLSRLDLPDAALAYLSACATSQTSAVLADEAVHVTSAFQIAGYAQVIGTLWPIHDRISSRMARTIYAALGQQGASGRSAAYAVHNAVCALRRDVGAEPIWASYIHVGA
jgi:hypothetical protein